jgi:hypothetical protein
MKNILVTFLIIVGTIFVWNMLDSPSSSPDATYAQASQTYPPPTSISQVSDVYTPTPSSTPTPSLIKIPMSTPTPTAVQRNEPVISTTPPDTISSALTSSPKALPTPANSSLAQLYNIMKNPSSELISRDYKYEYGWKEWTWNLQIPQAAYDYYKALPRSNTANYSIYVTNPLDDPYINKLVEELQRLSKQEGYTEFETVSFAAAFVQGLEYTSDLVTEGYDEYPRYPIETLVDKGGDCEDTAILAASIIRGMGYGVVLLVFPKTADSPGHCAVGVAGEKGMPGCYWEYNGRCYYYLETTGKNWEIGETPDKYQRASARIYPMIPVPILAHDWTIKANGNYAQLEVTVSNLGSADAQSVYVYAGFDAGNNQTWNHQVSPTFKLGVNQTQIATLNLLPPRDKYTRLIIQIIYGGYAVDESYSTWFDTY